MPRAYPIVERDIRIGDRCWRVRSVVDQDELLNAVMDDTDIERFPYGLLLWPSAIALAEWISERPELVRGQRVLELGAGVGLAGMVAGYLGGAVCATDHLVEALELARSNALANGVQGMEWEELDWRNPVKLGEFDLAVAADVLYERGLHEGLESTLGMNMAEGCEAVIADPVRPQGIDFIDRLERSGWRVRMEGRMIEWEDARREIALYRLSAPPSRNYRHPG